MAKKYMPWGEIAMVSLLGGVAVLGLVTVGLWVYRWTWDAQALVSMTGHEQNAVRALAFGIGTVSTAIVLILTTAKKPPSGIATADRKKRPGSVKFQDRRRGRR